MAPLDAYRFIVVGSGFFGAVMAERIATVLDEPVLVLERRDHAGGNAASQRDLETGIELHRYGSHLFHTSNQAVWNWINRFSAFTNYRHRVFTKVAGRTFTLPINLLTLNNFFGLDMTPAEAQALIAAKATAASGPPVTNFKTKAISLIGRELYDTFIRGYTAKQWQTDPELLPADIITRLPVRTSFNDFYFDDRFEGLPVDGYDALFRRVLAHRKIDLRLNTDFFAVRPQLDPSAIIVYTGPVDRYFDYRHGSLAWRTLDFEIDRPNVDDFQGAAVVNYPDEAVLYTRIHEFRHLHPERPVHPGKTLIMREYSRFAQRGDEPYYPVNTPADKVLYDCYAAMVRAEPRTIFGGRLGTYRYLDMHQAIAAALKSFERELMPLAGRGDKKTPRVCQLRSDGHDRGVWINARSQCRGDLGI